MHLMKQKIIFLFIGIVSFILLQASLAFAAEIDRAAADAVLTAYELGAVPAEQPLDSLPRWSSSLGEIQKAANVLLMTNTRLNGEFQQLEDELAALRAQIDQQKSQNAGIADDLARGIGKEKENNDAAMISRLNGIIADRNRSVQSQKEELAALKVRQGSINSRLALERLRVAELEVDRKSKEVEAKFRDAALMKELRGGIQVMRGKILKGEGQIKALEQKAAELERLDNPYILQAKELVAENSALKKRMYDLQAKKDAQQVLFEQTAAEKLTVEKDRNVLRVQKLLKDRDVMQARLKQDSGRLEALKAAAVQASGAAGVFDDTDKLKEQNALMAEIIGNLRENVALLEYKVTSLQRYKDRNK